MPFETSSLVKSPSTYDPAMTATTNPHFDENTEADEVAKAFASGVHGKTILITGVNLKGIGFSAVAAFVRVLYLRVLDLGDAD